MNNEKIYLLNDQLYVEVSRKINEEYQKRIIQKITTITSLYKLSSIVVHIKDGKTKQELIQKMKQINPFFTIKKKI